MSLTPSYVKALSCPAKLLIFHTAPLVEMRHTQSSSGFFGPSKPKVTHTLTSDLPVKETSRLQVHAAVKKTFLHLCSNQSIFQPPEAAVSLAKECVTQGCGVHLFVLSQQDVGGAWPGHVPYLTGGALYTYSHLQVRQRSLQKGFSDS